MKKSSRRAFQSISIATAILLAGCSTQGEHKREAAALYDLGALGNAGTAPTTQRATSINLSIAEISAPEWLDSQVMYYRLAYANDQQPKEYADSRWVMPPARLLGQRLKARIAQAGGVAANAADGATNLPLLRLEADDFTQIFDARQTSSAQINVRASLFNGRTLIAQKSFAHSAPAPSADAAGGAKALAVAGDALIGDIMDWLSTVLPLKK